MKAISNNKTFAAAYLMRSKILYPNLPNNGPLWLEARACDPKPFSHCL
jgi:hypothetical protein